MFNAFVMLYSLFTRTWYFVELEPLALYTEISGNSHGVQGLTCTFYEIKYSWVFLQRLANFGVSHFDHSYELISHFFFFWNFSFWGQKIPGNNILISGTEWRIHTLEITASMWFLSWWWMMDTRNICGGFSSCMRQTTSYRHNANFSCTKDIHWNQWRNRKCKMSLVTRVLLLQLQYDKI